MNSALTAALDALDALIGELERERDSFRQQCVGLQNVQAERDRLRAFLTDERDKLMMAHRGTTHWDGCEKSHRDCARIKALDAVLSASDSSERGKGE
jgi:hypothetical protein